jgi:hypothetical protein
MSRDAVKEIYGFATGGTHLGGLRMVGENGPELEYTPPSHISSNAQTKSMLSNDDVVAELKQLRQEMKSSSYAIAKNTRDSSKLMTRWDTDGLPEERDVAI